MELPGAFPSTPERRRRQPPPVAAPQPRVFSNGSTRGYGLTDEDIFIDSSPPPSPAPTKRSFFSFNTPPDSAKRHRTRKFVKNELEEEEAEVQKPLKRAALDVEDLDETPTPRKKLQVFKQTQTPITATRRQQMPPTPPSTIVKKRMTEPMATASPNKRIMRSLSKTEGLIPSADAQKRTVNENEQESSPQKRVMRKLSKADAQTPASPAPKRKSERIAEKAGAALKKQKPEAGSVIIENPNLGDDCLRQYLKTRGRPLPDKLKKAPKTVSAGNSATKPNTSAATAHSNLRTKRLGKNLPRLATLNTPPATDASATPSPTFSVASSNFSRKRKFSEVGDEETVIQTKKRCCDLPSTEASTFGLLYEQYSNNPFQLTFVANFVAKKRGVNALVGLDRFFATYPTEMHMARANALILERAAWEVVGLYGVRGIDMCNFAKSWLHSPPRPGKKKNINIYEKGDDGMGWEIGHITGIGGHAIDVWRVFCRDELLDVFEGMVSDADGTTKLVGYEWMTVRSDDPDLQKFLRWKWKKLGVMAKKFREVMQRRRETVA